MLLRLFSLTLALVSILSLFVLSGCLGGLSKSPDAVKPVRSFDDLETISQCPTFQAYQEGAEPAFQRLCMSCHASGRKGAGKLLFYQGGDDGGIVAAKNYFKAQAMAVVSAEASGEIDITVELLAYINGTRTHDLNIGIASSDYAAIRNWVESEINEKCVIDQVTGAVSVVSPSPTPTE